MDSLVDVLQLIFGASDDVSVLVDGLSSRIGIPLSELAQSESSDTTEADPRQLIESVSENLHLPVLLILPFMRPGRENPFEHALLELTAPESANLAVMVPSFTLASSRATQFRERLFNNWHLRYILFHNESPPGFHSSIGWSVLFLQPRKLGESQYTAVARLNSSSPVEQYKNLTKMMRGRNDVGYVFETPEPGTPITFEKFDPRTIEKRAGLAKFARVETVGDYFEISAGLRFTRNPLEVTARSRGYKLIRGRDIRKDGTVSTDDDFYKLPDRDAHAVARTGDIVVRAIAAPGQQTLCIAAEIKENHLPAMAGDHVLLMRPRHALSAIEYEFITAYLRSGAFTTFLLAESMASGIVHLRPRTLSSMPLPIPDGDLATAIENLAHARNNFRQWAEQADDVLESAFAEVGESARSFIINNGRMLRLRSDSAGQLDNLGHSIRSRFPLPLAYRWRATEAALRGVPPELSYRTILESAEILISYCALLALALSRASALPVKNIGAIKRKFSSGSSGPTFSDWTNILREISESRTFRDVPKDSPLGGVRQLLLNEDFGSAERRLRDQRNSVSHLRRESAAFQVEQVDSAFSDLEILYSACAFLADYSMVVVDESRWDSLRSSSRVTYRELVGDHPVVTQRVMNQGGSSLEQGSLYLREPSSSMTLLRPFLLGRNCSTCGHWSTFHPDSVSKERTSLVIKSLEHGHTEADEDGIDALIAVELFQAPDMS